MAYRGDFRDLYITLLGRTPTRDVFLDQFREHSSESPNGGFIYRGFNWIFTEESHEGTQGILGVDFFQNKHSDLNVLYFLREDRIKPYRPKCLYMMHNQGYNKYITFADSKGEVQTFIQGKNSLKSVLDPLDYLIDKIFRKETKELCDFLDTKSIAGPVTSEVWYFKPTDTLIYLFGDNHSREVGYIPYHKRPNMYLQEWIETALKVFPGVTLDLYLEVGPPDMKEISKNGSRYSHIVTDKSHSAEMINHYRPCLSDHKRCKPKNLRVHYTDMRDQFGADLFLNEEGEDIIVNGGDIKFGNPVLGLFLDYMTELLNGRIFSSKIYTKQTNNITYGPLKRKIEEWGSELFNQRFLNQRLTKEEAQEMIDSGALDELYLHLMDRYLVSRLFRDFHDSKVQGRTAVIYVGHIHARNISYFFQGIRGFELLDRKEGHASGLITVDRSFNNLYQPLP